MKQNAVTAAFESLLRDSGITMLKAPSDIAAYAAQRSAHLSNITGPDLAEAMAVEARNVMQFAGISAARAGDAVDQATRARIYGLIVGVLAAVV